MNKGKVYIGTSGWNFDSWLGDFYPLDTRKADLLTEYARHFCSVEVNSSFYNLPGASTLETGKNRCLPISRFRARPAAISPT